jgi:diacylglycerol O-acyltransferase / wax synthase
MERLSGLDATFLYVESPINQLHMTGVLVVDPSTMKEGYSFERIKTFVRSRLSLSPAFTRKLVEVPFRIAHPVWVEDQDFDLEAHVHRAALPAPGGPRELAELAGDIASRPLDRSRPLWDMVFVEGLEHGYIGLVAKMHHATIDGVSGANLMMHLFDLEPDPPPGEPLPIREPERTPSEWELLAYGLWSRVRRPAVLPRAMIGTARAGYEMVRRRVQPGSGGLMATPFTAPPTPFNRPVTPHRRMAFSDVPLADIRAVKDAFGTTVNDVILAVSGGAVRRWLVGRGALPDRPLVGAVPVSTRAGEAENTGGNFGANLISAMFVSLATDVEDPVERLLTIRERTKDAKEEYQAVGADSLTDWTEFSGPRLFGLAVRLYSRMGLSARMAPVANVIVSNVPGPPIPLYFGGGRLVALYPMGPVFDGMGLNITVLSHVDTVGFGFVACRELVPDLWEIADGVVAELDALLKRASGRRRRR